MVTPNSLLGLIGARGLNPSTSLLQALDALGVGKNQDVLNYFQTRGIPLTTSFADVLGRLGLTGQETTDQAWQQMQSVPVGPSPPSGANPAIRDAVQQPGGVAPGVGAGATSTGVNAPASSSLRFAPLDPSQQGVGYLPGNVSMPTQSASTQPINTPASTPAPRPPTQQPASTQPINTPASTPAAPESLIQLLTKAGMDLTTPVGQSLRAFGAGPGDAARLQAMGIDLNSPVGDVMRAMGLTGQSNLNDATAKLNAGQPVSMAPTGQFPQVPPIQLPPGLGPQPFQMPTMPPIPTEVTMAPEVQALMAKLQGSLDASNKMRDSLLSSLQSGIAQQQANANANQPLLDAALANIKSVLTGQAMSPGVEGLVNSAFTPAENEGQIRLRQAAEEAAAARGMHLTDTPIGQPYLDETRRFLEQMGGQRAQAAMGLRQQDAAFSENVRQFQEGLKQQALANQTEVLRTLGTPEQAASVLANLGLGARQSAVQEMGIKNQAAIAAGDQALRAALGQAQTNQGNTQLALASQAQGFQQQLAQQQASIQNQLQLMQALGDPYQAFNLGSTTGNALSQQRLTNLLNLSSGLLGAPPTFGPTGSTTTTSYPSNTGSQLLGIGTTLGAAGLMAPAGTFSWLAGI